MGEFNDMGNPVDVCTLGMFIIDDIDYMDGKGSETSIIGGGGTYVALGARLVAGRENASSVGWIVDMGSDFPPEFKTTLEAWQTRCLFREDKTRLTTRGWNGYSENEERAFKYVTPKKRLEADQLPPSFLYSKTIHMVCTGARCKQIVMEFLSRRNQGNTNSTTPLDKPYFVWEPIPDLCVPEELEDFWAAAQLVDVISPNEGELVGYFNASKMTDKIEGSGLTITEEIMRRGIGADGKGSLIVRTGSRGCTAFTPEGSVQMRPYFLPDDALASNERVVDPTGGGNTFLGGLCKAMIGKTIPSREQILDWLTENAPIDSDSIMTKNKKHTIAVVALATVAASFAIEQRGMPPLSTSADRDLWSNEAFDDRVKAYITRERNHILQQSFL